MNFTSDFLQVLIFKGSWEPQCPRPGAPGAPGALGAPGAPGAPGAQNHELELCRSVLDPVGVRLVAFF